MIIALTGPSGVGKGYVKKLLKQEFPFLKELPWVTTRSLRPGEPQGDDREHVTHELFLRMQQRRELILTQKLFGFLYGIRKEDMYQGQGNRYHTLTELHVQNVLKVQGMGIEVIAIALVPCDLIFLRQRLAMCRGTETCAEIEKRLCGATKEMVIFERHKNRFNLVVPVSAASEASVPHTVVEFVRPLLAKEMLL